MSNLVENINLTSDRMAEGYYLDNFLRLTRFIKNRYHDLLLQNEIEFIDEFEKLAIDAQRLFVRLIMRKGPYFRADKLNYTEIKIDTAIKSLAKHNFLFINPEQEEVLALQVFTKKELLDLFKPGLENVKSTISKDYLVFEILEQIESKYIWNILQENNSLIVPNHQDVIRLFKLLFFGNLRQGMEEFIFEDIGLLKFEKYEIREQDRFFDDRNVIESYFIISDIQFALWEYKSTGQIEEVISLGIAVSKHEFPSKFDSKLEKIYISIGTFLEKNKCYDEALAFFAQSSVNPSKERMVRILDKQDNLDEAFKLCSFLLDSNNYYESEFAAFFIEKIKKKLGDEYLKNSRRKFNEETITVKKDSEVRVEQAVLNYYNDIGWKGFHSESRIWSALTGIILWDIIYKSRPNVFYNPFQRGPIDLFSAQFYIDNKIEIENRFDEIANNKNWKEQLLNKYIEKHLVANHLVNWKHVTKQIFENVIEVMKIEDIIKISKRIIINPAEFKSGLPDLFMINPDNKYFLVEVKGPGDQLQTNQRRWLTYFEDMSISYYVQKVKYT